jgi:SAM-dependent methyltransferase
MIAQQENGCPICNGKAPLRAHLRKHGYEILRCPICGVGRAAVADFRPESLYNESYFRGEQEGAYVDYLGAEDVLRTEFRRQCDFLRRFMPGGKLLEIGCAYGFFLQEARRHFEVFGVEMAEAAVRHCHSNGLTQVLQGSPNAVWLATNGPFDAMVLLDVIEHIDDVAGTTELLLHHLRPGGVVLLTTGDWGSPLARLLGASWRLIAPPLHLWYFTPRSLRALFARFGCWQEDLSRPWKIVPLDLILDQAALMLHLPRLRLPTALSRLGLPANLFDTMRMVLRQGSEHQSVIDAFAKGLPTETSGKVTGLGQ